MVAFQENISLKAFNTFGIDEQARYFFAFQNTDQLFELLATDLFQQYPHIILGRGSNVLFTKQFEGIVLKNELSGIEIIEENEAQALVKFGAGEVWHECVLWAIQNGLGGIENLSLIPGTMGAAPMQNIGAYGVEIKSVVDHVIAVEKSSGKWRVFDNCECNFGYRESVFKHELKNQYIITAVVLKLQKQHKLQLGYGAIQEELTKRAIYQPSIKDVSDVVIAIRQSKLPDPKYIGNAGSFFKNPVISASKYDEIIMDHPEIPYYEQAEGIKIPAAWLIEQAGWKGYRDGDVGVHKKQALVLANYGNAKGLDIYNLSEQIINDVQFRYGIVLQREVNII